MFSYVATILRTILRNYKSSNNHLIVFNNYLILLNLIFSIIIELDSIIIWTLFNDLLNMIQ